MHLDKEVSMDITKIGIWMLTKFHKFKIVILEGILHLIEVQEKIMEIHKNKITIHLIFKKGWENLQKVRLNKNQNKEV